jgi:hypothetical protein
VASIFRSDVSLMVSSYEMEILQNELGISKSLLFHLPIMMAPITTETISQWPNYAERKDFVCVGNGKHAPNVDSIRILKTEIWPLIRKQLPDANLFVYGAYLPQHIAEMHNIKEGFHVKGWAEDIDTVLQNARLLLAPLQFGAGIKGKLLDAMRCGTPSITTSMGAEGMHKEVLQPRLEQEIDAKKQHLQAHRSQNFIGRMLQHHTQASTKYMAKWIEAKNR